jgi:hypothetical protein
MMNGKDLISSDEADMSMDEDQETNPSLPTQDDTKKVPESKWKNFIVRATFTCLMIGIIRQLFSSLFWSLHPNF